MLCSGLSTALLPLQLFSLCCLLGRGPFAPLVTLQPPQPQDVMCSPYLASQVQHVCVSIVEWEEETREPVDLLLYQGHGQIFLPNRKKQNVLLTRMCWC